jgi:hypothetical protein
MLTPRSHHAHTALTPRSHRARTTPTPRSSFTPSLTPQAMGDLAYNSGTESELEANMFKPYAAALRSLPLYTVVGNHDAISSSAQKRTGPYYNAFGMPSGGQSGGVPSGSAAFYRYAWYCLGGSTLAGCMQLRACVVTLPMLLRVLNVRRQGRKGGLCCRMVQASLSVTNSTLLRS